MNDPITPAYAAAPISNVARTNSLRRLLVRGAAPGAGRLATEPAGPASGTPSAGPAVPGRPSLARLPASQASPAATMSISTPSTGLPEIEVKNAIASSIQTTGSRNPARALPVRPDGEAGTTASAHPLPLPPTAPLASAPRSGSALRLTRTS